MKVIFTQSRKVKDGDGRVVESFEAGKVYELADTSAEWWKLQGCAKDAPPEPAAPKRPAKPDAPGADAGKAGPLDP